MSDEGSSDSEHDDKIQMKTQTDCFAVAKNFRDDVSAGDPIKAFN